jgi:hypothetical protein
LNVDVRRIAWYLGHATNVCGLPQRRGLVSTSRCVGFGGC